jgi:hypothetical protein
LTGVKINEPLLNYIKTDFPILPPGGVVWASLQSAIKSNLVNVATATGTPSSATKSPITGMSTVSAQDPSEVAKKIVGTPRSGDKPEQCLQDSWEDGGYTPDLVCCAKEVYVSEITSVRNSCKIGSMIKVNLAAMIHFNSARYDTAWYVATDGDNALTGTCAINGFVQGQNYSVTDGKGGPTVGNVTWNKDVKGGFDKCGDVIMSGGGGADIQVNFLQNVELKCVDNNNNSNLDIAI